MEQRREVWLATLTTPLKQLRVTSQSERKETWLVRRGEILKLAGRYEEARAAFNAALAAIESLPPERRQSRAVTALQLRARSALGSQ